MTINLLPGEFRDFASGDITNAIIVTGNVNTNVAGTYIIRYNVSDAAGNAATEVTRTVNVIPDTTAPVITLIGEATINLNVGDTYTEQGATWTDNYDTGGNVSDNETISFIHGNGTTVDVVNYPSGGSNFYEIKYDINANAIEICALS